MPLVKQASVRKLYPGQIVIELIERQPAGLWQKDGEVRAIAADGAPTTTFACSSPLVMDWLIVR